MCISFCAEHMGTFIDYRESSACEKNLLYAFIRIIKLVHKCARPENF